MPTGAKIVLAVLLLVFGLACAWAVGGFSDWVAAKSGSDYIAGLACLAGFGCILLIAWLTDRRSRRAPAPPEAGRLPPPPPNSRPHR